MWSDFRTHAVDAQVILIPLPSTETLLPTSVRREKVKATPVRRVEDFLNVRERCQTLGKYNNLIADRITMRNYLKE